MAVPPERETTSTATLDAGPAPVAPVEDGSPLVALDVSRTFEVVARDSAQDSASRVIKSGVKAHGPLSGMLLEGVGNLAGLVIELRDPNTGTVLYRGQLR